MVNHEEGWSDGIASISDRLEIQEKMLHELRRHNQLTRVAFAIVIVMVSISLWILWDVVRDTNQSLELIESTVSPEAIERRNDAQRAAIENIQRVVGCESARRMQIGFDGLAAQGIIDPINVSEGC